MNLDTEFSFGQYKGLTLQQVYQGTLNPDRSLLSKYLQKILNNRSPSIPSDSWFEFIEEIVVDERFIRIVGTLEYFETGQTAEGEPIGILSEIKFGNLKNAIQSIINYHFNSNWLGILQTIQAFNCSLESRSVLGGDPGYVAWCIKNVDSFTIDEESLNALQQLPVAYLNGIEIMYINGKEYDYAPSIKVDSYSFSEDVIQWNKNKLLAYNL